MKNMKLFAAVILCVFGLTVASGFATDKSKSGCCTKGAKVEKTSTKEGCCTDKASTSKKDCSTKCTDKSSTKSTECKTDVKDLKSENAKEKETTTTKVSKPEAK